MPSVEASAPVTTGPASNGSQPTGEPVLPAGQAFSLGWNVCRLYLSGTAPRRPRHGSVPPRLPSPGRLGEAERSLIRLGQVRAAIDQLDDRLAVDGQAPLSSAVDCHIGELEPREDGSAACDDPKASICEAHLALAQALSSSDARLAKAYQLGVSLASTCYAPVDAAGLRTEFNPHRVAQLGEWMADLCALFPDHACRAVRLSCTTWRLWVEEPLVNPAIVAEEPGMLERARGRATAWTEPFDIDVEWTTVRRALARQGEVWRALLSGEKPGTAMLELRDYVAAGARGIRNGFALVRRMWLALFILVVVLILGMAAVVTLESTGAKIVGLVTIAGSLGFAWKGVLGGVGAVLRKFQEPVWGAALDEEIAEAITILPAGAVPPSTDAPDSAPAAGPQSGILPLLEEVDEHEEWAT